MNEDQIEFHNTDLQLINLAIHLSFISQYLPGPRLFRRFACVSRFLRWFFLASSCRFLCSCSLGCKFDYVCIHEGAKLKRLGRARSVAVTVQYSVVQTP